jgi:hypothetical protein
MSGAALAGAGAAIAAIEQCADEEAFHDTVRAYATPLGYDRFVIYTARRQATGRSIASCG